MHVLTSPISEPRERPKKGIRAEVLIDGFSPGAAGEWFAIGMERRLIADYLLASERGFRRIPGSPQLPEGYIFLQSEPEGTDQFRVAFGLTLLENALEMGGRMGFRLLFSGRSAARFIQPADPASSIRFLEAMEGVDEVDVRFRYRDPVSLATVKGNLRI